ncbi:MAG: hypothetical protein PHR64_00030 [Candidatus Shapirobacteria bacterium]|nr:hypothetical protein [Candidatus Shapirobacteria bacterium]
MKKSIILILAAGVFATAGLFWAITKQNSAVVTVDEGKKPAAVSQPQEETLIGTLRDIIAKEVPMRCVYEVDGVEYEGLVKGKNYRGKVSQDGQVTEIIVTGGQVYLWQEGKVQGMKMAFDIESAEEEDNENVTAFAGLDIEYRCLPVVVTDDQFSPPEEVDFFDLDQTLDQGQLSKEQIEQLKKLSEEE